VENKIRKYYRRVRVRYDMHIGHGSECIPDFTAEIFDVGRINLAQYKVLWHESGNTQTAPFNVSLSILASSHVKSASVATNHQRRTAEVQDKRDILYVQVLQQTGEFVIALATPAFLKLGAVGFFETSVVIHQNAPKSKPQCTLIYLEYLNDCWNNVSGKQRPSPFSRLFSLPV
jgi:hypothetical protein